MKLLTYIKNAFKFTWRVIRHKYWVGKYCFKCGLYWQGITHDLSKFSPTEFFESVKYYVEGGSPINESKRQNGWSRCWFHHRGNNLHHYEAWFDKFDSGGVALPMPRKYAVEMLCDYLGAGKAYHGRNFTYESEYKWWQNKRKHCSMNVQTMEFIEQSLMFLYMNELEGKSEDEILNKKSISNLWYLFNTDDDIKRFNDRKYND